MAMENLSSSIRSFRNFGFPLLLAQALNNRGVFYFMNDKLDQAEKDWKAALRLAKKAKSMYSQAWMLGNLADIEVKRGDLDKALKNLNRAEANFRRVNDFEGLAWVEFNRALVAIAKKDYSVFIDHFERSEKEAYPLPPEHERELRRNVILDRAKENGMPDIVKYINGLKKR